MNEHQPSSDCQGGTQDESEDDRSFEHSELFAESRGMVSRGSILPTERQLADNENLLPCSKEVSNSVKTGCELLKKRVKTRDSEKKY